MSLWLPNPGLYIASHHSVDSVDSNKCLPGFFVSQHNLKARKKRAQLHTSPTLQLKELQDSKQLLINQSHTEITQLSVKDTLSSNSALLPLRPSVTIWSGRLVETLEMIAHSLQHLQGLRRKQASIVVRIIQGTLS